MDSKEKMCKITVPVGTETDKEVYGRELLNQPMWVQIAGLSHTVIISLSE